MKDSTKAIKKFADEVIDAIRQLEGKLASYRSSIKLLTPTPYKNGWVPGRRVKLIPAAMRSAHGPMTGPPQTFFSGRGTIVNPLRDDAGPNDVFVAFDNGQWVALPDYSLMNE